MKTNRGRLATGAWLLGAALAMTACAGKDKGAAADSGLASDSTLIDSGVGASTAPVDSVAGATSAAPAKSTSTSGTKVTTPKSGSTTTTPTTTAPRKPPAKPTDVSPGGMNPANPPKIKPLPSADSLKIRP